MSRRRKTIIEVTPNDDDEIAQELAEIWAKFPDSHLLSIEPEIDFKELAKILDEIFKDSS